jgi:hypothetical protein
MTGAHLPASLPASRVIRIPLVKHRLVLRDTATTTLSSSLSDYTSIGVARL